FQGELRAVFTSKGELVRTTGKFAPQLNYNSLAHAPAIAAEKAVALASQSNAKATDFKLQYFPLRAGVAVLAWSFILQQGDYEYYILVDAVAGKLLFRKNITNDQSQSATYSVYSNDSPSPLSPSNATPGSGIQGSGVVRTTFTLISELLAFDNLGWIPDGV